MEHDAERCRAKQVVAQVLTQPCDIPPPDRSFVTVTGNQRFGGLEGRRMVVLFGESTSRCDASAEISDCGRYRWWLRRSWQFFRDGQHLPGKGVCCFVMLNPSTADGKSDDPTIRRCIGFAKSWGYNTLSVRNLFPWRATDPAELRVIDSEIATGGARGDCELLAAMTANLVVVAWGANVPRVRDDFALQMFRRDFPAVPLYCLGLTAAGKPRHPLYVRGSAQPQLFEPAR